jgi:transposase
MENENVPNDTVETRCTPEVKEYRRLRAWQLYQEGWSQAEIARALGVTPGAVSQWFKRAKAAGPDPQSALNALKRRIAPGPPPRLTPEQKQRLAEMLQEGAEAHGFRGAVWTQRRVADLIRSEFGVEYHPFHMYRLLRELDFTHQKPTRRATQRDEEAIQKWLAERWPALKQTAKRKDGR